MARQPNVTFCSIPFLYSTTNGQPECFPVDYPAADAGLIWSGTKSVKSVDLTLQIAHPPFWATSFLSISLRISTFDRISEVDLDYKSSGRFDKIPLCQVCIRNDLHNIIRSVFERTTISFCTLITSIEFQAFAKGSKKPRIGSKSGEAWRLFRENIWWDIA